MQTIRTGNKLLKANLDGGLALNKTSLWLSLPQNYKTGHLLSLLTGAVLFNHPPEGKVYTAVFITAEDDIPSLVIQLYTRFKFAREDLKIPRDSIDVGVASAYVNRFALDHGWQLALRSIDPNTFNDEDLDVMLVDVLDTGPNRIPGLVLVDNLALVARQPAAEALEDFNAVREERGFHLAVTCPLDEIAKRAYRDRPTTEAWLDYAVEKENYDTALAGKADHVFLQHVTNHERLPGTLHTGEVTFKPAGKRAAEPAFVLELNDVSSYPLNEV